MEGVVSPSSNHLPSVRAIVYNSDQICFPQGGGPEVLFRRAPAPRTMRWGRGPPTPPTWRASTTHLTAKRDGDTLRMGGSTALETRRPPRSRTRTAHRIAMDRSLTRTRRRQQARPDVSAGARTTAERQWFNGVFFFFLPPACPVRTGCLTISDNWGGRGELQRVLHTMVSPHVSGIQTQDVAQGFCVCVLHGPHTASAQTSQVAAIALCSALR